ncbi:MAG TPA: hemerythrin domain-containing protein [Gammaproteobacteria bacterium]
MAPVSSPTALTLGYPVIDAVHDEMTLLLAAALMTPNGDLSGAMRRLRYHCEHHFALEETLMNERHFAGYDEHHHEHRKLLAEMNSMLDAVARGRHGLARAWLSDRLPEWFRLHVANLDGLLVSFLRQN